MIGRKIPAFCLWLIFLAGFCISSAHLRAQGKNRNFDPADTGPGSLIKKEKLPVLEPSLSLARRDLFRPSSPAAAGREATGNQGGQQNLSEREEEPLALLQNLDIIYLGLASFGGRKVALLDFGGEPLILSEGEELLFSGLRLVSITPEEILIKDDKNNSRKIRLKET